MFFDKPIIVGMSLSLEQKDIIAEEIQLAKEQLHSKDRAFEKLAAKEICSKYRDGKAGHVPEEIAVPFATALCLCLRKKNSNITEVNAEGTARSSHLDTKRSQHLNMFYLLLRGSS